MQKNKIYFLDGLRGFAALAVVFNHFIDAFYPKISGEFSGAITLQTWEKILAYTPFGLFFNGDFAVCIFFVISGLVISRSFFQHENFHQAPLYVCKRYLRFVLPVAFSALIAWLITHLGFSHNKEIFAVTNSTWVERFFIYDFGFFSAAAYGFIEVFFFNCSYHFNPVLWTMVYEFWGSILIYFLLYLFGNKPYRAFIFMGLAIFSSGYYVSAMMFGVILSDQKFYEKIQKNITNFLKNKFYHYSVIALILLLSSYPENNQFVQKSFYKFLNFNDDSMVFYHSIAAFLLLIFLLNSTNLQKFLSSDLSRFFGRISFSIYLIHPAIIVSFSAITLLALNQYLSYFTAFFISLSLTFILTISLANFIHRYVDLSGINFANFVMKKILKISTKKNPQPS